ncbi:hypothetical protein LSCM1_04920 [Leishmania martiniquensis]|uniref:Uncharacterized protein n=1 Tax=Leishmania martiniquensis TaxID=1580590 RepID=A0A836GJW3_9TRYP|nr:hypothetical protein LSCM1_04920 [Leishmania martiniquensis]
MAMATKDVEVEVDLSKLIDVGLTFLPLQLTIKDILQRLARLEKENAMQNDYIAQLTANVAGLEAANEDLQRAQRELEAAAAAQGPVAHRDGIKEGKDAEEEHAALWEEMSRLNELLGNMQGHAERGRHTIDEIYAARKQQNLAAATASGGSRQASLSNNSKSVTSPSTHSRGNVASASGLVSPGRGMSAGSAVTSQKKQDLVEGLEASVQVGDIILSKAHEALELVPEVPYSAFCNFHKASLGPEGDSGAHPFGNEAGAPVLPKSPPVFGSNAERLRRRASVVDGPYEAQGGSSVTTQQPLDSASCQEGHTASPLPRTTPGSSLTWAAATGGEDAGEHREFPENSAGPLPSMQQQYQHLQRPSTYAERRMTVHAARRASSRGAAGGGGNFEGALPGAPPSVFDKLRRDGEDIAYLNRVVAEILGEMKGLHEDVDFLRANHYEEGNTAGRGGEVVNRGDLHSLLQRVARVEGEVIDVRQRTGHRDNQLQEELDDLKKQLRVARGLTDDDVSTLRRAANLAESLHPLEQRVTALEAGQGMLREQFATVLAVGDGAGGEGALEVNALQFAALQGAVAELEKQLARLLAAQGGQQDWTDDIQKLKEAVRAVEAEVESTQDQLQRLRREASRLDEVKANRTELPEEHAPAKAPLHSSSSGAGDGAAMAELVSRLSRAEANIERLSETKADRTALHKLRDELNALRQLVELANSQRSDGGDAEGLKTSAAMEKMLRELQGELGALKDAHNARFGGGLSGEDAQDLMDRIDRLDHCKADATLVANKAERDYVENALERLMREVEQVLNASNAGLIDTLEKSLGILRDMIDGKATKQDVANLQGWMSESNAGGGAAAPDGLTGFKGFRCLGCNRPMDSMRPRTLPGTMASFLNRNPQNHPQDNVTRTIQQQQAPPRSGGGGGQVPAVVAAGVTASSVRSARSPNGSFHRSSNSEPLPPIEPNVN